MDAEMVKELLDVCFLAKKATETMPPLPPGMGPRHVHILDAIQTLEARGEDVHVGDVSTMLKITTPSITRLIAELEAHGYVFKKGGSRDRRYVSVFLSPQGRDFHSDYVKAFHAVLAEKLAGVSDEDCRTVGRVVRALLSALRDMTSATQEA